MSSSAAAAAATTNAASKKKRWLPLESNPGLMNKYMYGLGASKKWAFSDVWGVDEALLGMVPQPSIAVLLLFPITEASEKHKEEEEKELADKQEVSKKVYFMKQLVGNACGTVGLLHALLNVADKVEFEKGKFLHSFLEKTKDMSPQERGEALGESDDIEEAHQDVANEASSEVPEDLENVNLHFNAFVCVEGCLYELDGRKAFPINHGKTSPDTLLADAVAVVKKFMARDPNNIRFNMVSLGPPASD
eukprot:TRINITY_DN55663_c0_g1_i1.p2 TRINITY_DN55663_c0_g1~~TRINITY_DN55663_c0_g1_i1.p2  ORF type:complete len:258 (+),score=151.39 TRINITY_DN55663_c0_g1_i1:31-774(+)